MAFEKLQLTSALCFGWRPPVLGAGAVPVKCWYDVAEESITKGWRDSNVADMENDLAQNVDSSYFYVAQGEFEDLVTGFKWRTVFVNDHMLWKLDMPKSPNTEALPQDAEEFFKSKMFLKFAKRCGDLIDRADKMFRNIVEEHLKNGEFLQVSEPKLERILFDIETSRFMANLRTGKYELN